MSKIIYRCHVALNGLIEMPGEIPDWVVTDEELFRFMSNQDRQIGGFLWGRKMYENNMALLSNTNIQAEPDYEKEFDQIWKQIPITIFSSTFMEQVEGNVRVERDDPVAVVTRLKAQPGPDLRVGGVQLTSALIQAGLIDEYQIYIQPILLGTGRSIYPALNESVRLKLIDTHTFRMGVVFLHYQC
jgi:dihydrofolate reductase